MALPYPVTGARSDYSPDLQPLRCIIESDMPTLDGLPGRRGSKANCVLVASQKQLLGGLSNAFDSGKYQDLIIGCRDRQWKVHRLVMCTRSKFFEKACEGNFKEGILRYINLEDEDPELIEKMLLYLYKSDYPDDVGVYEPLVLNASMYALADRYDIDNLKTLAKEKFSDLLRRHAIDDTFTGAVYVVYNSTLPSDRGLRDCIAPKMRLNWLELRGNDTFMDVVKSNGDIAIDMVDTWAASNDKAVNKSASTPGMVRQGMFCPVCNDWRMTEPWFRGIRCSACHTSRSKVRKWFNIGR